MPRVRKKPIKEVQVIGPALLVNGVELVAFKTEFKADDVTGLNQAELSALALKHHNEFIEQVTADLSEKKSKLVVKAKTKTE